MGWKFSRLFRTHGFFVLMDGNFSRIFSSNGSAKQDSHKYAGGFPVYFRKMASMPKNTGDFPVRWRMVPVT
jgi:hypothetical protein